jgi:hypothetical protein
MFKLINNFNESYLKTSLCMFKIISLRFVLLMINNSNQTNVKSTFLSMYLIIRKYEINDCSFNDCVHLHQFKSVSFLNVFRMGY